MNKKVFTTLLVTAVFLSLFASGAFARKRDKMPLDYASVGEKYYDKSGKEICFAVAIDKGVLLFIVDKTKQQIKLKVKNVAQDKADLYDLKGKKVGSARRKVEKQADGRLKSTVYLKVPVIHKDELKAVWVEKKKP